MQTLLAGPRAHLTEDQVLAALDVREGGQVGWGVDVLNRDMTAAGVTLSVTEGSVAWSYRAESPLRTGPAETAKVRRTATLTIADLAAFNPLAVLFRPWVQLRAPEARAWNALEQAYPTWDDVDAAGSWAAVQFLPLYGTAAESSWDLIEEQYPTWDDIDAVTWVQLQSLASFGVWVRWHLGVFTSLMPPWTDDGMIVTRPLTLAEKPHLYQTRHLRDPLVLAAGTAPTTWIAADLAAEFAEPDTSGIAASAKTLSYPLVFEPGTSRLDVYNTALGEIGYGPVFCDEDGVPRAVPRVDPATRSAEWTYRPGGTVLPGGKIETVDPELPNVVRFVARRGPSLAEEGNGIRTVRNQTGGPGSITARGYEVHRTVEVDADTQVELDAHAAAVAQYLFAGGGIRFDGGVGLNPAHSDEDIVRLVKPRLGIDADFLVTGWSVRMFGMSEQHATTQITCEQIVAVT